jgi:hypothetical protein
MMRPLRLTNAQLDIVRDGAKLLRPHARAHFLQLVARELADIDLVTDDDVHRAVNRILFAAPERKRA